jgi:hypothetical protein
MDPGKDAGVSHNCRCRVTAIRTSAIRESVVQPSAAGARFPRLMAEQPTPESPTSVAVTCHLEWIQLGQHAVAPLPQTGGCDVIASLPKAPATRNGYSTVVRRSRPYPFQVMAVSGWRLGTQAECFVSIQSALDSALNAVLDSVLSLWASPRAYPTCTV